jgi:hypothetical protein
MVKNAQKQAYFGINNSHKPHTASTSSYKKYSKLKLQNLEIQGFKISRILEWGGGVTPARRLGNGHEILEAQSLLPTITTLHIFLRWRERGFCA